MNEFVQKHQEILGKKTVEALKKNRFDAMYCDSLADAREKLMAMIPDGASISFGGSMTIKGMDVQKELKDRGCTVYDHNAVSDPAEKDMICRQQLTSDVFLSGCNAITCDGKLYNVDGTGNRVAAMIFGPKQVILVAGMNKVVPDLKAAEERVKFIAAPTNSLRVNPTIPCTQTGYCIDCNHEKRICNAAVVLHRQPPKSRITVLLVGENCGF